jgi:hypothetical protein
MHMCIIKNEVIMYSGCARSMRSVNTRSIPDLLVSH